MRMLDLIWPICVQKFDHSSFSRSGWRSPKFKWFTWPDHASFRDGLTSIS